MVELPFELDLQRWTRFLPPESVRGHSRLKEQHKQTYEHGECAQGRSNSLIGLDSGNVSWVLEDELEMECGWPWKLRWMTWTLIWGKGKCWGEDSVLCHLIFLSRVTSRGEVLMDILSHYPSLLWLLQTKGKVANLIGRACSIYPICVS